MKFQGNVVCELQPGYPELSGQDANETITVMLKVNLDWIDTKLPTYDSPFTEPYYPFFQRFFGAKLKNRTVHPLPGGGFYEVTLTYEGDGGEAFVKEEVEYSTQDTDIPVEQHKKYKTYWNYRLAAKKGMSALPAWHKTATDTVIPASNQEQYVWVKGGDRPPSGFNVIAAEKKPGVEAYRSGITTVHAIFRSTSKKKLQRSAKNDYTLQDPPDDFGLSGVWLRGGSKIVQEGRHWVLTVDYLYSKNADKELYE